MRHQEVNLDLYWSLTLSERRGSVGVHGLADDGFSVCPQFVLAQIDIVIPGYPITTGINMHCPEEGGVRQQVELGTRKERSTVIGPVLTGIEADKQPCLSYGLDRVDSR